jgi:hypothetical protein
MQLEEKFRDLAVLALPAERVDGLVELCTKIDILDDVGDLCRATIPATTAEQRPRSREPRP